MAAARYSLLKAEGPEGHLCHSMTRTFQRNTNMQNIHAKYTHRTYSCRDVVLLMKSNFTKKGIKIAIL